MPDFSGVHHIDLTVRDVEASARWYSEVLGLRRLVRTDFADRIMVALGHPATRLVIGLNEHAKATDGTFTESRTGLDHVGFTVDSRDEIEEWQRRLAELGVEHSPIADTKLAWVLVFRDPDNIQLEMYAPKRPPATT